MTGKKRLAMTFLFVIARSVSDEAISEEGEL